MFRLAFSIGIFSLSIFIFGIMGLLYKQLVIGISIIFILAVLYFIKEDFRKLFKKNVFIFLKKKIRSNWLIVLFISLFALQAGVNLIGVFGPEIGFDALWYHLMLPKLYLLNHTISFIPGGLLYYSAMPKLAEMLYVTGLAVGNENIAKFIHFGFGLLTCLALYKLQRKFFTPLISLIGVVIFYANLVVGWESTSAYIDLVRAFFEIMALWGFINWFQTKKQRWLVISACMVGFAITTKLLASGSLVIFSSLLFYKFLDDKSFKNLFICLFTFLFIGLLIPMPWFIFSYLNTGNPVYPFFTSLYHVTPEALSPIGFVKDVWVLFTQAADPISPVYLIFFPLIVICFKHFKKEIKVISLYSLLAIIVWYFTPRTGGGRFILPYLPAFSLIVAATLNEVWQNRKKFPRSFTKFLIFLIIFVSLISVGYRFAANQKYLPVIFGQETKREFLTKHLHFGFGDFYDTDEYFKSHIQPNKKVLLYGFHNLYYVEFPFIDITWVKPGDTFHYIALQNTKLPSRFKDWNLVYTNRQTMVKLYTPSPGTCDKLCTY